MSIKSSDDSIGNRTLDFPTCSAVPQPTAPPRVPHYWLGALLIMLTYIAISLRPQRILMV